MKYTIKLHLFNTTVDRYGCTEEQVTGTLEALTDYDGCIYFAGPGENRVIVPVRSVAYIEIIEQ